FEVMRKSYCTRVADCTRTVSAVSSVRDNDGKFSPVDCVPHPAPHTTAINIRNLIRITTQSIVNNTNIQIRHSEQREESLGLIAIALDTRSFTPLRSVQDDVK